MAVRILAWGSAGIALVLALLFYLLRSSTPVEPQTGARLIRQTAAAGGVQRSYLLYVPAKVRRRPALVVMFHGSMGTAEEARATTGYQFERLADRDGFLVAYPQGVEGNWNDCRKAAGYAARRLHADDVGLFKQIVARTAREQGADRRQVFAAGVSSGGHAVFRLVLEHPELLAGAAVFAASLPAPENSDCSAKGPPPPIMLVNGTRDPINPYRGGTVSLFGFGSRGTVLSTPASAARLAALAGATGPTTRRIHSCLARDSTWVEQIAWRTRRGEAVVLLSVHGGGHLVPQPSYRPPRLLGRATSVINGPAEAWRFFERRPGSHGC